MHTRRSRRPTYVVGLLVVLLTGVAGPVTARQATPALDQAGSEFVVLDLGTFGGSRAVAVGVNDRGEVAGWADLPSDEYEHAFHWVDGAMTDLGTLGGTSSMAVDLNNRGEIVGIARDRKGRDRATRWDEGRATDLGTLGGDESGAIAINEYGEIAGWADTADGERHAALWRDGQIVDLGTLGGTDSWALDINAAGEVVGGANTADDVEHAFLWREGTMIDLSSRLQTRSLALGVNAQGEVVGQAETRDGGWHAVRWADGTLLDLGTLGGRNCVANDVDASGQIVGTSWIDADEELRAFLWRDGTTYELDTLGGRESAAIAISATGLIAGWASTPTERHAALWVPAGNPLANRVATPAPSPVAATVRLEGFDIGWRTPDQPGPQVHLPLAPGTVIELVNVGNAAHNFESEGLGINQDMPIGYSGTVTVPADAAPGEYDFICNIPGHAAIMYDTITILPVPAGTTRLEEFARTWSAATPPAYRSR